MKRPELIRARELTQRLKLALLGCGKASCPFRRDDLRCYGTAGTCDCEDRAKLCFNALRAHLPGVE